MVGGNEYTEVLDVKDIYDAYKSRSKYVQAYLALAGKGWGERPWTTFDKFVDAMCKYSESPRKCKRAITGIDFEGFRGNFWLGNGNPTIIGLYSEISSHGCHGATVLNDQGEPAFGFIFKSTFCIYLHSSWDGYFNYGNTRATHMGECCVAPEKKIVDLGQQCADYGTKDFHCWNNIRIDWKCNQWADIWQCEDGYNYEGPGESSEDCKQCIDIEGWIDASGNFHTDPFPLSFYQSQPLLLRGN